MLHRKRHKVRDPEFFVSRGKDLVLIFSVVSGSSVWLTMYSPGEKERVKQNERFILEQVKAMRVGEVRAFQFTPDEAESTHTVRRTS